MAGWQAAVSQSSTIYIMFAIYELPYKTFKETEQYTQDFF